MTLFYYFFISFLILFAGAFHALGILKATIYSLGIGLFVTTVFIFNLNKVKKKQALFLIFSLVLILISTITNFTDPVISSLYYFNFFLIPSSIYTFSEICINRINKSKFINFLIVVGIIQLPIILIQLNFKNQIASFVGISSYDVGFGSFPLANDHVMCFYLICLSTYLLWIKDRFSIGVKILLISWFSLTIAVSNSNISLVLLAFMFLVYILQKYSINLFLYSIVILPFFFVFCLNYPDLFLSPFSKFVFLYDNVFGNDYVAIAIEPFIENNTASRPMMTYYLMFIKENTIWGEGPYAYFNPIEGKLNFPNHSQLLWFYLDLGIFGLLSIFLFVRTMINGLKPIWIILISFFIYSYVAVTMGDISFVFILVTFYFLISKEKNGHHKYTFPSLEKN